MRVYICGDFIYTLNRLIGNNIKQSEEGYQSAFLRFINFFPSVKETSERFEFIYI